LSFNEEMKVKQSGVNEVKRFEPLWLKHEMAKRAKVKYFLSWAGIIV